VLEAALRADHGTTRNQYTRTRNWQIVEMTIWVQPGSIKTSRKFLTTPKVAARAVGCQSVTVKRDLDGVEVWGSSPLVPSSEEQIRSGAGRPAVLSTP
jgi:hypothetical protein